MRMVGATNHFIRMPFIVEGLVLGEIAALLAFGLDFVVYNYLAEGFINATGLVEKVFYHNPPLAQKREKEVLDIFKNAELLYKNHLKQYTLDQFLEDIKTNYPL